jgi:F-type H+-transporting ATPase subunit O
MCVQIDPAILGGAVVQVGDKTIDLSVNTKLNRLNQLLTESA